MPRHMGHHRLSRQRGVGHRRQGPAHQRPRRHALCLAVAELATARAADSGVDRRRVGTTDSSSALVKDREHLLPDAAVARRTVQHDQDQPGARTRVGDPPPVDMIHT